VHVGAMTMIMMKSNGRPRLRLTYTVTPLSLKSGYKYEDCLCKKIKIFVESFPTHLGIIAGT